LRLPDKRAFFEAWNRGKLGNKLQTWSRPEDVPGNYTGRLMFRRVSRLGGSDRIWEFPVRRAIPFWTGYLNTGRKPDLVANETAPDRHAVLQGELLEDVGGLRLFAAIREPEDSGKMIRMREALLKAREYRGLTAEILLRRYCSPASYDDLQELLILYPDHVVEFSAYSRAVGWAVGRNVLIWEVRLY